MYRYVFKRVKETFDRGVNARKSYACQQVNSPKYKSRDEKFQQQQQKQQQQCQVANLQEINFLTPIEHQKKRYEDFRRKYNCKHPNSCNSFLHAITWSTALVAGFYAAQLLCLYRRNHRLDPTKCLYTRYLDQKSRLLQNKVFCAHQAKQKYRQQNPSLAPTYKFDCPVQKIFARRKTSSSQASAASSSTQGEKKSALTQQQGREDDLGFAPLGLFEKRFDKFYDNFGDNYNNTYTRRVYFNVNNEQRTDSSETLVKSKDSSNDGRSSETSGHSTLDIDEAAIDGILSNLSEMIGEMEFQLGVDSILNGRYADAVDHFRMAASSNHANSLFNLALLYEQGLGVKRDKAFAYKLYKSAGELGHDKALFNMGIFHARGFGGVKKSSRMAKRFFEKSAALGNADAIEALAMLMPSYRKSILPDPDDFIVADDGGDFRLEKAENRGRIRLLAIT